MPVDILCRSQSPLMIFHSLVFLPAGKSLLKLADVKCFNTRVCRHPWPSGASAGLGHRRVRLFEATSGDRTRLCPWASTERRAAVPGPCPLVLIRKVAYGLGNTFCLCRSPVHFNVLLCIHAFFSVIHGE